eukprot:1046688-Amphidinium_carterae.1
MSSIGQRFCLNSEEASLLLQCSFFWPDSMVDASSFMKMLAHVLNLEAQSDVQVEQWEEELIAFGACPAPGVVDVKRLVALILIGDEGPKHMLGVLSRPPQEDQRLAALSEASNDMLATINTKPGGPNHPSGGDMSSSSWTLSTAVLGEQTPLPLPDDHAGAVVVVQSKQYVLGERLGRGGGGS